MNRIFKVIWSRTLGKLVVASEAARSQVKSSGTGGGYHQSAASLVAIDASSAGALRPLVLAIGLAAAGGVVALTAPLALANIAAGDNIIVDTDDEDEDVTYTVSTADDVTFENVTAGGLTVSGNALLGALTVTGDYASLSSNLAMGNNLITGLAAGTADDHAVNVEQLTTVSNAASGAQETADDAAAVAAAAAGAATAAGAPWTVSADGDSADIGPNGTVTFEGDGNISVALNNDVDNEGTVTVTLDENLTVTSITTGEATLSTDGLAIGENGPRVTSDGINVGGLTITGLADGELTADSTEAVSGRQIFDLFIEEGAGGVRYFRAASARQDSEAVGAESIAIGPETVSEGESSFAAGDRAQTTIEGEGAIALGQNATAGSEDEGGGGEGAIAVGRNSVASNDSAVALGDGASAIAGNATALGGRALASSGGSIAIGDSEAAGDSSFAAGAGAYAGSPNGIALGTDAGIGTVGTEAGDQTSHIAIGTGAGQNVDGNQTTAIGFQAGSDVTGLHNVAVGSHAGAGLQGNYNVAIGHEANRDAGSIENATAVGGQSDAARDAAAVGYGAQAADTGVAVGSQSEAGEGGVALGRNANAEGSHIALGIGSAASNSNAQGTGYLTGSDFTDGQVVSVGNASLGGEQRTRRIVNVADGSQDHDAVNVNQLRTSQQSVANLVGGNVTVEDSGAFAGYVIELTDTDGDTHQYTTVAGAINAVSSGEISVLPGDAVIYNPNGTVTVAEGVVETDAVNVAQLNEAVAENGVKYFSVNSEITANRNNAAASGIDAMAIGPAASAGGRSSLAAGHLAHTVGTESVALGYEVEALGDNSTVVGSSSTAYHDGGVAIGLNAESHGENSIVMGTRAHSHPKTTDETVDNAIVIGTDAEATADNGIAIGESSLASELRAVAQGYDAHAVTDDAMAFGSNSRASGISSQASGTNANASGQNAQASGTNARASGYNSIASGTGAIGYATDGIAMGTGARSGFNDPNNVDPERNTAGIAIGNESRADQEHALALGVEAQARAKSSAAIGDGAEATADAEDGLAVGSSARVTAQNASAFGQGAEATAEDALAAGSGATASRSDASAFGSSATASGAGSLASGAGATASAANASALGQGATAGYEGSVALGSNSQTAGVVRTPEATIDGNTYEYAGATDSVTSTVSVGQQGAERTITNVAAGRVNENSTDAINGSQLYGTNMALESLADDLDTAGRSVASSLGGGSSYDPETHEVTAELTVRGDTYDNVQDALGHAAQGWNVSAEGGPTANVAPGGSVDFGSSDSNIDITRDGTDLDFALTDDIEIGNSITVGDTFIDGDEIVTNSLNVANNLNVGGGTFVVEGDTVTYGGDEIATQADGLSFAGNTGGTISRSLGDDVPLTIAGTLDGGESASGANLRVDRDGNQLNLVMARDLTDLNSIAINDGPVIDSGGIDMNDTQIIGLADGTSDDHAVNLGQLNDVEATASRGWDVSVEDGEERAVAPGAEVNFSSSDGNIDIERPAGTTDLEFALADDIEIGNSITFVAGDTIIDGERIVTNNLIVVGETRLGDYFVVNNEGDVHYTGSITEGDHIVNKTYVDESVDGLADTPLVFAGDAGESVERRLGETVNLVGAADESALTDSNIGVVANGSDTLEIRLAQNIDLGDEGSIDIGDGTDGSNLDADGLSVADGGNITTVGAGGIEVTDTDGTTIIGGNQVTIGGDNAIAISGDSGTIEGLTNRDLNGDDFAEAGRAATEEQLSIVNETANLGWNVSANGEDEPANVAPGATVDFSNDDGNIVIDREDTDLVFNLADDIEIASSITVGDTYIADSGVAVGGDVHLGDTGLVINGGPSVTTGGIEVGTIGIDLSNTDDDGNTIIAGVGRGEVSADSTDAINGSQLYEIRNIAEAGWNLSGSGENAVNIGPDGSVDFQGDDNITVSQSGSDQDGVIEVALNDSITLGEGENAVTVDGENALVSVGDTSMSGDGVRVGEDVYLGDTGLVIADGPSVTVGGIDAGGIQITSVASGLGGQQLDQISGDDLLNAVNVGDLQSVASDIGRDVAAARSEVEAGSNINVTERTGDDGQTIYTVETQRDVAFDSIEVGSVNINQDNVDDDGNTIISGVGRGEISEESTDAVNGSQLYDVAQQVNNIDEAVGGGIDFGADEGPDVNRSLGDTVAVRGDDNITTRTIDNDDGVGVQVTMNRDLDVDSVTAGNTTVNNEGVTIEGGPSMTVDGIDGGGMRITNVAPGVDATDAVNVGQMHELNQRFANEINNVHGRIDNVERNANAGTASALAASTVPQAWMPGKSMVGVGAGTYEGESAISVGVSRLSDNGRWIIQGRVTGDSQSNFGAGVGAGWHW